MGNGKARARKTLPADRVGVVLRGDLDLAGVQVPHRVVAAPVAEFQLIGLPAAGKADYLVTQADAENGEYAPKLLYQLNDRPHILGISGTVGEKQAVRLHFQNLPR